MGIISNTFKAVFSVTKLRRIAKILETRWIKGNYVKGEFESSAKYCLVGATNYVTKTLSIFEGSPRCVYNFDIPDRLLDPRERLLRRIWRAILTLDPNTRCETIENWNDRVQTTHKRVTEVLNLALAEKDLPVIVDGEPK